MDNGCTVFYKCQYLCYCIGRKIDQECALDLDFGIKGIARVDISSNGKDEPSIIKSLPDGSLLIGGISSVQGSNTKFYAALAKLDVNGNPDNAFGSNGKVSSTRAVSNDIQDLNCDSLRRIPCRV